MANEVACTDALLFVCVMERLQTLYVLRTGLNL